VEIIHMSSGAAWIVYLALVLVAFAFLRQPLIDGFQAIFAMDAGSAFMVMLFTILIGPGLAVLLLQRMN
jgi:hypothetical protein